MHCGSLLVHMRWLWEVRNYSSNIIFSPLYCNSLLVYSTAYCWLWTVRKYSGKDTGRLLCLTLKLL